MRIWLLIVLLEVLYVRQSIQDSTGLLKVSVYYESLCPDSIRFINRQLYPAYQTINSSLLIDFVPYGKASQTNASGEWQFTCQHGPKECWGNKAQACGLAENKGQDNDVEFVNCVMGKPYPANELAINNCAPKLGLTGDSLIECAENVKGNELHAKYGDQTHAVRPVITFVPTIVFNDTYDQKLQDGALNDFLWTACSLLDEKPSTCPSEPANEGFFMDFS